MKKILPILVLLLIFFSFNAFCVPALSSLPTAKATIFLDFDGHYVDGSSWNGGVPFYCTPSGLNDTQITEVFNRVSEDYRPFNINITTDSAVFIKAPFSQRIRIIVTLTSAWYQGVGGVSFTGSFTWGDDTPGFVFPDRLAYNPKIIADCCTHESGHTVGLSHQAKYNGTCNLVTIYNDGAGTGEIGWAPVMGNSYGRNISGWNNGPTPSGCTADQDNLSIITSRNGFTYRVDDHSDDPNDHPTEVNIDNSRFATEGIITTNTDRDVFQINLQRTGLLHLDAKPFSVGANNDGANLDMKLTLLNSAKEIVAVYDPKDILNVVIDTTLHAGNYYVVVQGAGNANATNYGSLGSYKISGTYAFLNVLSIKKVMLKGQANAETCSLSWDVDADESLKDVSLETSSNGTIFSPFKTFSSGAKEFTYVPLNKENVFYRLRVTSVTDQVVYSNTISLKLTEKPSTHFVVTTSVTAEIKVNAPENYRYQLGDLSGRILKSGSDGAGANRIDINQYPNGIYFLQIISNSQRITQRILKL
jgi:hypothetical protein